MPYATQRDRTIRPLETRGAEWPAPPLNAVLTSGYQPGVWDIRWDIPAYLAHNSPFVLYGVNVYRSFDSEYGPYELVTDLPIGANFWRDRTDLVLEVDEDVSDRFLIRDGASTGQYESRYVFQVLHQPIVKAGSQAVPANSPSDVQVFVDNKPANVLRVLGHSGEVELDVRLYPEVGTQKLLPAVLPGPNSVVTCTYRHARTLIRTDLIQRVFYRLTTVASPINPECPNRVGPLVETPLEYATMVSSMEIEKIDYIWREAVRRNSWILDQGGERVKLLIRKSVGPRCPCIPASNQHRQPISDCHICFAPGTLVRTAQGWTPIQTIQVGDQVLASDGALHRVCQVFATAYDGPLMQVTSSISAEPLLVTPNHPFRALRGTHKVPGKCGSKCDPYIYRGDGLTPWRTDVRQLPGGRWLARAQVNGSTGHDRKALGTYASRIEAEMAVLAHKRGHSQAGHVLAWVPAGELVLGDWLLPCWNTAFTDVHSIKIPPEFLKTSSHGPQHQGSTVFLVDADFLWVVGMYLAEGSASVQTVNFSLHQNELLSQDRLRAFFHRYGYASSLVSGNGRRVSVQVHSAALAQWLSAFLGCSCHDKRLPEDLTHLPVDKTWALIQGICDGGGSKVRSEIVQASKALTLQLVELLHRVGAQPLVKKQTSRKRPAYLVSWAGADSWHSNRKGRWLWQGHILAQIREIGQIPYKGQVYNLSVEGDETYVAEGIVVHNCYGTGIVGGYEGPYDITIAPDDAERKIAQRDMGRTVEHSYEVFTGPSPLINHRDFVVKVNGERYSVGPVRMPTNRGMVLQQHFTIGHFDEKDVRHFVPMDDPYRHSVLEVRKVGPERTEPSEMTDKPEIPQERQERGRTGTWENIEY